MNEMPWQLPLDLTPRPHALNETCAPRSRLYFALLPPPEIAEQVERYLSNMHKVYHLTEAQRPVEVLHITLFMMSDLRQHMPQRLIDSALAAGETVQAEQVPVSFDRVARFGKHARAAIVMMNKRGGSRGIHALTRQIAEAAQKRKCPSLRLKMPHMTLAYSATAVPDIPLPVPFTWIAREFALVQSFHGETRHSYLGRWPLLPGTVTDFEPQPEPTARQRDADLLANLPETP